MPTTTGGSCEAMPRWATSTCTPGAISTSRPESGTRSSTWDPRAASSSSSTNSPADAVGEPRAAAHPTTSATGVAPPPPVDETSLDEVRRRRVGLRRAMNRVEEATSAALAGRPDEWRTRLAPEIDELRDAWELHVSGTEGPGGLWEQIRADAPR